MNVVHAIASVAFFAAVLRVSTPYLCAALGGVLAERVGLANIALEGQMLTAACVGALVSGLAHSMWLGAITGVCSGALVAVLLAAAHLELGADPIIAGIGMNILASGGTMFAVFALLHEKGGTTSLASGTLPRLRIPVVGRLPVLGPIISGQSIATYLAIALVPMSAWLLQRSRFGFHVRAVGEAPAAAAMVGIQAKRVKYATLALSGALAGLGGVFLSMSAVSFFVRDMTAGRGFIALAAVFLGGVRPVGAAVAAVAFGTAEALAIQLGNFHVPTQLITAVPYLLTVIALGVSAGRRKRAEVARATG